MNTENEYVLDDKATLRLTAFDRAQGYHNSKPSEPYPTIDDVIATAKKIEGYLS